MPILQPQHSNDPTIPVSLISPSRYLRRSVRFPGRLLFLPIRSRNIYQQGIIPALAESTTVVLHLESWREERVPTRGLRFGDSDRR